MRFSTSAAIATSVACRPSVWKRSPPPMMRFRRAMSDSTRGAAWERATGYGRRNAAEWTFSRLKRVLGPGLRSRGLGAQRAEAGIAVRALNRMAALGMPRAERIA